MTVWLESPYFDAPRAPWLRGNLHTHTRRSDGALTPQEMIDRYARAGYDFLMLSDHDVLADLAGLDARGLTLLRGNEISTGGQHVLDVGARVPIAAAATQQEVLDRIAADSGFAVLCHPNCQENFDHFPYEQMAALRGYTGVEIFNAHAIDLPGRQQATDKWDRLMGAGRRLWGYANDDAHQASDVGRAWNMVQAADRSAEAIAAALRQGRCYASTGVTIDAIACQGPRVSVRAASAEGFAVVGHLGRRLAWVEGPEMVFDASAAAGPFVRIEGFGRGDRMAWTQPLAVRGGAYEQQAGRLAAAGATEPASLAVLRSDRPPVLGGTLDDPLWQAAPVHERFFDLRGAAAPPVDTSLRCIACGSTLYFGLRCAEPLLEGVDFTGAGTSAIWSDDSVEVFLDVEGQARTYFHLVVAASGRTASSCRGPGAWPSRALTARTGRWAEGDRRGWAVELAVPLPDYAPAPGARWGLHVCRNRRTVPGHFVWSWVGGSNHNAAAYGRLVL